MGVKNFKKDFTIFLAVFLFSIILYSTVQWYDTYVYHIYRMDDFLNWHIGLEGFSIIMSFCIFFISFYTVERSKNLRTIVFLTTFLSVGLLDTMHTLTYKGMPNFLTVSSVATATSYWIAGRLTAAVGLLVAGLVKRNNTVKVTRFVFVLASLLYSVIVIYLISYRQDLIPPLFIEGTGLTPLKIILEYVIIILQVINMLLFYRIYRIGEEIEEYKYIILSLLVSIFSELAFTQYSSVYDTYNFLGHIYKIIAYYLIFKSKFVLNVQRPYLDLQKAERKMVEYANSLEKQVEIRTKEIRTANEKLMNDMDYARNIQTALLPLSFPKADKLQFASRYLPCEKIGGDFYNVFRLDEDNFGILIGDVAGHGVSAAMITVFINQNIHVRREFDDGRIRILTPKQVLTNLFYTYNRMTFPEEIYTVLFYGIYNQKDMTFTYCSAGMNAVPLLLRNDGSVEAIPIKGLPICRLGGLVSPSYENQTIQLEEGDSILFYTDGLIEIDRKRPDQFNEKNLMEYLRGLQNSSAAETVDYMFDLYNAILGENKMIDDVTVLVVKIEGESILEEVV
jgi:sigma-B regulation protein RsbU (phosphoserine phosphatase)